MSTNRSDFPISIGWAILTALAALAVAAFLLMCTGCYSTRKAQFQVSKAQVLRPAVVAKICADLYPPKVIDSTRTEYREGQTIYRHDTVTTTIDCPPNTAGTTRTVRLPCPPCPVKVDTVIDTRFRQVENTARVSQLTGELQKERDTRIKAEGTASFYKLWFFILLAYNVIRIVLRVWLKINLP